MTESADVPSTRDRVVDVALSSFAARGFEATSLDDVAAELGVTKQTVLYYHPSKDALLGAVIERAVANLATALRATSGAQRRLEAVVDELFRIGATRPELLALVREALRLGPPASTRLTDEIEPLVAELAGVLRREAVLTAAAIVVGMATEVDVLRGFGIEPTRGALRRRRRILLDYLTPQIPDRNS